MRSPLSLACLGFAALAASTWFPAQARAESERGPFFVEGHVTGVSIGVGEALGAAYPFELSLGYHVLGTHEGFVVGVAQRFDLGFSGVSSGATVARLGWDFAIPAGDLEVTIAPYAQGGILYVLAGGDPGGLVGFGVEGRLFPFPYTKAEEGKAPVRTRRVEVKVDHIEIKEKIQFKANEAEIESVSFPLIEEIASVLRDNPRIKKLRIEGHASSEGDAAQNRSLSDARARAVRDRLVGEGKVDGARLLAQGFGADKPIADNESDAGREKNRRVEFNILEQDDTVTREETRAANGPETGFFIVAKPFELDFAILPQETVPVLSFQAGIGWAF